MPNTKRVKVYVAGPISKGNTFLNCVKGVMLADKLLKFGYAPFCPHLSLWWQHISGRPPTYDEWLSYDFEWVKVCDVVLRMPGKSPGADAEVEFAKKHNIPVVKSIGELKRSFPCQNLRKKKLIPLPTTALRS